MIFIKMCKNPFYDVSDKLLRATQVEDKLRRENIQGKSKANQTHFEVGMVVRQTIEKLVDPTGMTEYRDIYLPENITNSHQSQIPSRAS